MSDLAAELQARDAATDYHYEDELIGQALIRQWTGDQGGSEALFEVGMKRYDIAAQPDAIIHLAGNAMRLPSGMKAMAIDMGEELLVEHPNYRWILFFQGYLLLQEEDADAEAGALFQRILALPNRE